MERSSNQNQTLFTELQCNFVLLGRGTGPNEFEGNIRFREMVAELAMSTTPKELSANKPVYARKVVDQVLEEGGRFVRKLSRGEASALQNNAASTSSRLPKGKDVYVEVPDSVAMEKAKQSFRHQQRIQDRDPAGKATRKHDMGSRHGITKKKNPTALKIVSRGSSLSSTSGRNNAVNSTDGEKNTQYGTVIPSQVSVPRSNTVPTPSNGSKGVNRFDPSQLEMLLKQNSRPSVDNQKSALEAFEEVTIQRSLLARSLFSSGTRDDYLGLLGLRQQQAYPKIPSHAYSAGFLARDGAPDYSSLLSRLGSGGSHVTPGVVTPPAGRTMGVESSQSLATQAALQQLMMASSSSLPSSRTSAPYSSCAIDAAQQGSATAQAKHSAIMNYLSSVRK